MLESALRRCRWAMLAGAACAGIPGWLAAAPGEGRIPALIGHDGRYALMVDGAPFLMLGAQANNSSNYPAMLPQVWPALEQLGANTLEMPVAWEQIEPKDAQFDFTSLDTLLGEPRPHQMRVVLLWFGTWKNNGPNYAPAWVKLDNARFPRLINAKGEVKNSLTPLAPATLEADRKAFARLMRHLKETDGARTVIMVQVENETGTYRALRDYSPLAERAFAAPVPERLLKALHKD